jgi:hypothetical protein
MALYLCTAADLCTVQSEPRVKLGFSRITAEPRNHLGIFFCCLLHGTLRASDKLAVREALNSISPEQRFAAFFICTGTVLAHFPPTGGASEAAVCGLYSAFINIVKCNSK